MQKDMSTRTINLELAGELPTASFIQALRCFISKGGHPKQVCSGVTNFASAKRDINEAFR